MIVPNHPGLQVDPRPTPINQTIDPTRTTVLPPGVGLGQQGGQTIDMNRLAQIAQNAQGGLGGIAELLRGATGQTTISQNPTRTMNDINNTGLGQGMLMIEPAVVGPMLDEYRARRAEYANRQPSLGNGLTMRPPNMGQPQVMPRPSFPQPGGGLGGQLGGGFGGGFGNQTHNMPIPELAAQTVGQTVGKAIESRLPQMQQGIGQLIGRALLSGNGQPANPFQGPLQAVQGPLQAATAQASPLAGSVGGALGGLF